MNHDIFISYSHVDKTTADAICSYFENNGLRCWYAPRDITPGADWADSIIQAIADTKVMVLIFTKDSNISKQVLREVNNAVSEGVTIVPFRLTKEEPVAGMKYYLSTVHWLDAMDEELDQSIRNLYRLCRTLVDQLDGKPGEAASVKAEPATAPLPVQIEKKNPLPYILAGIAVVALVIAGIFLLRPKENTDTSEVPADSSTPQSSTVVISDNISQDITETYTQGNSQGNLQSGGYMATDGEWYYYRSNEKFKLCKMRPDGSDVTVLSEEPVAWISVYDGYVYYNTSSTNPSVKRIKTDGTGEETLHFGNTEDIRLINDRIYYQDSMDSLHLYSMNLEGRDVVLENTLEKTYSMTLDGTYMYFSNQEDGGNLYRVNIDGSDLQCILDHKIEGMTIGGNYLYFNDLETNYFSTYDLSTGEVKELVSDYIYYINVTEEGIYGYSGTQNCWIAYIQPNGLGLRIIVEEDSSHICVCGDKIYYHNDDDNTYYIVNKDGTGKMKP